MLFQKKNYQPTGICVKKSPLQGRGVFAKTEIARGELVEAAPALYLTVEEKDILKHTSLFNYYFLVNNSRHPAVFGFGYASFYNHSPQANAFYSFLSGKNIIQFYA